MRILELAVKPCLELRVADKVYRVEYPVTAVAEAAQALGHSLVTLSEWFDLKLTEVAVVLYAGLKKHHPEVTREEIQRFCDELGAEGIIEVRHALICLNFPKAMERIEKRLSEGQTSPNAQSADAR